MCYSSINSEFSQTTTEGLGTGKSVSRDRTRTTPVPGKFCSFAGTPTGTSLCICTQRTRTHNVRMYLHTCVCHRTLFCGACERCRLTGESRSRIHAHLQPANITRALIGQLDCSVSVLGRTQKSPTTVAFFGTTGNVFSYLETPC